MPPVNETKIKARQRMMLAQQVARALAQGAATGTPPRNDRRPSQPSPQRAPVGGDSREGELRTEGQVAKTGPRKGSRFTEIVRNGRVFHKYGDDLGTGLGGEVVEVKKPGLAERLVGKNDPAMGKRTEERNRALQNMAGGTIAPPRSGPERMPRADMIDQLKKMLRQRRAYG